MWGRTWVDPPTVTTITQLPKCAHFAIFHFPGRRRRGSEKLPHFAIFVISRGVGKWENGEIPRLAISRLVGKCQNAENGKNGKMRTWAIFKIQENGEMSKWEMQNAENSQNENHHKQWQNAKMEMPKMTSFSPFPFPILPFVIFRDDFHFWLFAISPFLPFSVFWKCPRALFFVAFRIFSHFSGRNIPINMESPAAFTPQKEDRLDRWRIGRNSSGVMEIVGHSSAINGTIHLDPRHG